MGQQARIVLSEISDFLTLNTLSILFLSLSFTGSYCIYKANNTLCPTGMNQGYFVWDDNYSWWTYTRNKQGGTLPDGLYNSDTKIMYCCQNKGKWYLPIELPVQHPFYLLPRNNSVVSFPRCQLVKWTMNWLEYIDYPTVDSGKIVSKSGGDHVFVKDLRLGYPSPGKIERAYYCYYQGELIYSYFSFQIDIRNILKRIRPATSL